MRRHLVPLLALAICAHLAPVSAADYPGALADHRVARGTGLIAEAWLADPTTRYQHYVLGSQYEAGSLVVRLSDGTLRKLVLPETSVFEDRQPRLADLDGDGVDEIILVRSTLDRGAALAVVALKGDQLTIVAETPPTGRRHTWLNPAGIADYDGDGRLDIAYVQMPHVLGLLRVWTFRDGQLVEIAQVPGVSNHLIGSPHLAMSATADFDGDGIADLALPSLDRRSVRVLKFKGGAREIFRQSLPAPAVGDFVLDQIGGRPVVGVGLQGGLKFGFIPRIE